MRRLAWAAVFAACALPLALIGTDAVGGRLGADPIAMIMNRLGFWALFFLLLSLAPTPLKILFGWNLPLRFRRMVGLFAFFYASAHLATYVGVDQFFDLPAVAADIVKRKFITVGFLAFLLLVPLAITSTDRWVRRLGFVQWKRLHRLSYLAAVCGVIHFVWRVKVDLRQPMMFGVILAGLFAVRIFAPRVSRSSPASRRALREGAATTGPSAPQQAGELLQFGRRHVGHDPVLHPGMTPLDPAIALARVRPRSRLRRTLGRPDEDAEDVFAPRVHLSLEPGLDRVGVGRDDVGQVTEL